MIAFIKSTVRYFYKHQKIIFVQAKWTVQFPFDVEKKYKTKFQVGLPIVRDLADFYVEEDHDVPFDELFPIKGRSADDATRQQDNAVRRKRDLHVFETRQLYNNLETLIER